MKNATITLSPLREDDREQFILDNQWAFQYGAMMEFGRRDDHTDEEGEIISRETIEHCMDDPKNETYRILLEDKAVGGVILAINKETHHNHLEILFVAPEAHGKGIGFAAWQAVEALHPETRIWETCTPYFEKRNIHFYVNKCGFHIVEFFHALHADPNSPPEEEPCDDEGPDEMFRFVKIMRP
ncbi:MAG: GNAT family N-acetyltransferase [Clostridia bacterium]|nr:GNAT family N-acetyltransferase [Clostridia bacterium]